MLRNGSWCLLVWSTLLACQPAHDVGLVIANATVYDGTANAPFTADVGVVGDQIAWIASDTTVRAVRTIDATGYALAPGFIDPHTHSLRDLESAGRNSNINYLTQGVTTVVNGNDGGGPLNIPRFLIRLRKKA